MTDGEAAGLGALLARAVPGRTLPGPFYVDAAPYALDLEAVWRAGWLFCCHSCELDGRGAFVTFEIGDDPLVVVRQRDGSLGALHNVCRHRASLVTTAPSGRVAQLVCPYHGWVYALDGSLVRCPGAPGDIDKDEHALRSVAVFEVAGLVFVSLATDPPDTAAAIAELFAMAEPQGLSAARVAHVVDYVVEANWKLIWENNRECLHCARNHPEYVRANFDVARGPRAAAELAAALDATARRTGADGLFGANGLAEFPDRDGTRWWSAHRTALAPGFLTESLDGEPVAPLMGAYREPGVGTLRMRSLPNFWSHTSGDHAVTTRLVPAGPTRTKIRVTWLVAAEAEEGRDYDHARLTPFWERTSEQDWAICERQQRGVRSSSYVPGPLSPTTEANVEHFLAWYRARLAVFLARVPVAAARTPSPGVATTDGRAPGAGVAPSPDRQHPR